MGRTPCCSADGQRKGAWTADEDQKLIAYIQEHGEGGWRTLPQKAGLQRCGKSCRLRWANYLRPDIKRGEFSSEEAQKIIKLHARLGNRWSTIASHLPMRTDNEIKNYWNTHIKKRLAEMGIDPVTHKPIGPSSSAFGEKKKNSGEMAKPSHMAPDHDQCESIPLGSSRESSAQLLNKLAARLASSRCVDALKASQSLESISTEGDSNISKIESPSLVLSSPEYQLTMQRPTSASANILNKMASRRTTPLHCLNTLKSILSKSNAGGDTCDANIGNTYNYMPRSTSTSSLSESTASEISRPTGVPNEMAPNLAPLDEPFDLELLKDWQGVSISSNSIEGGNGGSDGSSIGDVYNIDSPVSSLNFKKNDAPKIAACKSSTLSHFLSERIGDEILTTHDHEMAFGLQMEPTSKEDNPFMDEFTNFVLGDDYCYKHVTSTCSRDSHNGDENDRGLLEDTTNYWNEDWSFEIDHLDYRLGQPPD